MIDYEAMTDAQVDAEIAKIGTFKIRRDSILKRHILRPIRFAYHNSALAKWICLRFGHSTLTWLFNDYWMCDRCYQTIEYEESLEEKFAPEPSSLRPIHWNTRQNKESGRVHDCTTRSV